VTPFSRAKSWVNETIAIPYPKKNDMSIANSWLVYCQHKNQISQSRNLEKDFLLLQQHAVTHTIINIDHLIIYQRLT
jgi:hypothetical protein